MATTGTSRYVSEMNLKDQKVLVWDRGACLHFATALGGENGFGTVFYYNATQDFMAKSQDAIIGRGYPDIERVDSFWSYIDDVDTIVFPDVGDGDLQTWLRSRGYNVWGSGKSEMLELDRWQFLKLLTDMKEEVPETTRVEGIRELRDELADRKDVYLKTSFFRGDFETVHCDRYEILKPWIDELEVRMGPRAEDIEILIQEPIEGVEPGYDGFNINGHYPKEAMWGWEAKDSSYIGKTSMFEDMPLALQETCLFMAQPLKTLGMRGSYHSEVRIDKTGRAYLTDPTCRYGAPPGEVMAINITNWGQIVYGGARGEVVEPEFAAKYACQVILKSMWVLENFLPVKLPKEFEPYLRLRRGTILDGKLWAVPSADLELIGSACGIGDTAEEAIDMAVEVAESIEAFDLTYDKKCKETLEEVIEKGEESLEEKF